MRCGFENVPIMNWRWIGKALFCLCMLFHLLASDLDAQRSVRRARESLREIREDSWPPERAYSRVSLGYALQRIFKKHYNYCGFAPRGERRDYIPPDINRFLGRRTLRTRVEVADISGGNLLQYIFRGDEIETPLSVVHYRSANVLNLDSITGQFLLDPDERFDAFLLTKNCAGYLKSALDAGIEPPYSAFRTALDVDDRRESIVLAISGSFVSPLEEIIQARDVRTTELMLRLWQFYRQHPQYIGQAYYLREIEGVMIKHLATSEQGTKLESEVGINVNIPLAGRISANSGLGRSAATSFRGTDWETIVYTDFEGPYTRRSLYAPLPGPAEISAYFNDLRPLFRKDPNFPMLTEGTAHQHNLIVEGVPDVLCRQPWIIDNLDPGVYNRPPALTVEYLPSGRGDLGACRFTVTGEPERKLFRGSRRNRPGQARLRYRIRSQEPLAGYHLALWVEEELPTSAHPTVALGKGSFDLSMRPDRRFAFQWRTVLDIEDSENPIDFEELPQVQNIQVRRSGEELAVQVVRIEPLAGRHQFEMVLETNRTLPLMEIDDRQMLNYEVSLEIGLKSKRSNTYYSRSVQGSLSFPGVRPPEPEPEQVAVPESTPEPGSGGNGQ